MKIGILILLLSSTTNLFGAEKRLMTTKERAANMFRSPSGKEEKINRKFQPIDHVIKTKETKGSRKPRNSKKAIEGSGPEP